MRVARADHGRVFGAVAGVIVAATFWAFGLHVGGEVPSVGLPAIVAASLLVSVVPGWIIGSRLGPSLRSTFVGMVAYALVSWTLLLPVAVIGSTWAGVRDGTLADPISIAAAMGIQSAYAAIASLALWVLAMPFAVVWIVAFRGLGYVALHA